MDAAFSSIVFAEPLRAEENLERLAGRLPQAAFAALPAILAQLPDPDGGLNLLERFVASAPESILTFAATHPTSLHHMLVVFSYSRFLSETLIQQPELVQWLARPGAPGALDRIKTPETLHEEYARFEAMAFEQPPSLVLARFKRREYLRIMLRDVLGLATLAEVTMELSHLADVLLERALRICTQKLENQFGTPQFADEQGRQHASRIAVIALGKLGANELNYNSDIDLMFLYRAEGETSGGSEGAIRNSEFFIRLAQSVLKIVTDLTPLGSVFRVDLRLRPQGHDGALAVGAAAAIEYYQSRAREWELQMLIKARAAAGDAETLRLFLNAVRPRIFLRGGPGTPAALAAIEAALQARDDMTRELQRKAGAGDHSAEWNVKLTPGGIRDIEFLVQVLQRVHGGDDPWLSAPAAAPTLVALQRLHDKGHLTGRDFFRLGTAYQFFRRVEHRLQLRDGLQRHTLPEAADAIERLARRCGVESAPGRTAGEQLRARLRSHFAEVREVYERILRPAAEHEAAATSNPEAAFGVESHPALRRLVRAQPRLAKIISEWLGQCDDAARRSTLHYLDSAVLEPAAVAWLAAHPQALPRLALLLARSEALGNLLRRFPERIPLLDELAAAPAAGDASWLVPPAAGGAGELRRWHQQGVLAALVQSAEGTATPFATFARLSALADAALQRSLELALHAVLQKDSGAAQIPLCVCAVGRLGTQELDFASDADLIFVTDDDLSPEEREPWRRVVEAFLSLVGSQTREGMLMAADTRLRPHGHEGELLVPRAALLEYFEREARAWEAVAYLKLRPVAGDVALGERVREDVLRGLRRRFADPALLAAELLDTRRRLEEESPAARDGGDFKRTRGGYYDVEYVCAYLTLCSAGEVPRGTALRQIAGLESAGALDSGAAQTLRTAALFYRCLDHALRVATDNPARQFPEAAQAPRIVALLESWQLPLAAEGAPAGRLAAQYAEIRRSLRSLFERFLLTAFAAK